MQTSFGQQVSTDQLIPVARKMSAQHQHVSSFSFFILWYGNSNTTLWVQDLPLGYYPICIKAKVCSCLRLCTRPKSCYVFVNVQYENVALSHLLNTLYFRYNEQSANSSVWFQSLNRAVKILMNVKQKICAFSEHTNRSSLLAAVMFAAFLNNLILETVLT